MSTNLAVSSNKKRLLEYALPALAVVALTIMCVVSAFRLPYWFDELLSYYLVSDPSFSHMLGAQGDLINAAPPLYFILVWPVAQIFGAGELPLRLCSSLGISAALLVTWNLLRRLYGAWPAAVGVTIAFFGSDYILYQNMEGRFYGLFLFEVSVAVWLAVRMSTKRPLTWPWLAGNALIHAALVTTHYFGFVYSAAIMGAMVLGLRREPRALLKYCGSALAGWLAFVPWIPMFVRHLEFNRPHSWIPDADFQKLSRMFLLDMWDTLPAVSTLVVLMLVMWWATDFKTSTIERSESDDVGQERRTLAIMMLAFFLLPVAVWLWSMRGSNLFLGRYFLPDVLVWSSIFAFGIHWVWQRSQAVLSGGDAMKQRLGNLSRITILLLGAYFLIVPSASMVRQLENGKYRRFNLSATQWKLPIQKPGVPIVLEDFLYFVTENYYSAPGKYCVAITDRLAANDPAASRAANNLDQIAEALKRQYPALPIFTTEEFLHSHDKFLVVKTPKCRWFETYVADQPQFQCETLSPDAPDHQDLKTSLIFVHNLRGPSVSEKPGDDLRQ